MSVLSDPFYTKMAGDATLTGMVSTYNGEPAIFTIDPPPGDADLPYIVSAGEVTQESQDTKNSRGREAVRDIRCYAPADGSAVTVEAMAERVRALFHRKILTITGYEHIVADCGGPTVADEADAYGRVLTVRSLIVED